MKISYVASSGNIYDLTARVMIKDASFHAWAFESHATSLMYGERVSSFRKKAQAYRAELVVGGGIVRRKAILNALHDDFENDVRNVTPGRIIYGDWYCDCFIASSQTQPYEDVHHMTENTIEIYVPSGFWMREESRSFSAERPTPTGFLKYPYDYDYDYTPPMSSASIWETESPFPSDFVMTINGPCTNPRVTINGYPYVVNASIPLGETLVIDSRKHTVMMGDTNLFDARGKEYSVFEKIPAGALEIAWDGFDFSLTLMEERSEPKW